ncbi:MAG: hybrid sensor histidine kinase/response regulator [Candidatus Omnitrophota bacterium]|jgi:signal transduction histidine kinase|nr:MAG: hybrid sensor histidine kinase/response regulator [Candidatus Omnitrophota bacterium]
MSLHHTILCVDDEQHNLDALYRTLRKEYTVVTALNGEQGLQLLEENRISLIISDQRMPGMTGVEFLEKSLHNHPDIIRIILTGFTDVEDLIGAINTGRVYRYITKPWDPNDLKVTVKRAIESLELSLENRRLFEDVIRLEKLATIGQVASGIAHEVRNQLSVLMGIQLIQSQFPKNELIAQVAEQMLSARNRILSILDEIKAFGRQEIQTIQKEVIAAGDLLDHTVTIVSLDPDCKKIQFDIKVDPCPPIPCDRKRIIQVLINLIRNGAHAMNGEGTMNLTAAHQKGNVQIKVQDFGCGIPEDQIDKIWDPFFTTKGEKGTGLGLEISKRISQAHHGRLRCTSEVGKGTTFILELPC